MSVEVFDLHCHSIASDGNLAPVELVKRAAAHGVTTLALTDHDTTQGLAEAETAANDAHIKLISGIEISTSWHSHSLHIVGLNIDPANDKLQSGIKSLQTTRLERAQKIADKLAKKRIPDAYQAVTEAAGAGMVTRSHFADFLLKNFHVSTHQEAFDRYLGRGKPAYVSTAWASLDEAIHWITDAGGIAVIAHPIRYKLSANWMNRLLTQFKAGGGQAVEIVTGRSNPDEITQMGVYLKKYDLYGSAGSDFHSSQNQWVELGRLKPLPVDIKPVWELF